MAAIKLNDKAREEARQSLHDMGFIQPEHRKYELKTNDGRSLGSVSYGAKNAIEREKLDSYVPKDDDEKKTLDDFKAYVNEQAEKKKQQRINSNPVTKKYGIDPDNFT